jgi:Family of unknown function (DUF6152)
MRSRLVAIAAGALFLLAGTASAHHSFALFDHDNRITLTGVVSEFQWTNPHVYIELNAPDGKGGSTHYSIECASVNVLTRAGWKFNDIKKGDKVTLLINPLRDGSAGGMLETATLADGRTLSDSNPPGGVFPR